MESLVSTMWLAEHLEDPDLVVLDCTAFVERTADGSGYRSVSGRKHWEREHIIGSGFADLTGDLCADDPDIRYAVPRPEQFTAAMGALGIGDDSRVVLYDAEMSMWAARVWWMLRWVGFDNVAVLDGGWKTWKAEGRSLSTGPARHRRATLTPQPRTGLVATRDEVLAAIGDGSTCIIDALGEAQFRGDEDRYGRRGHIPGARNVPATSLVDPATERFLPNEELAERFSGDRFARTITYCGGGIAASCDAFVMTRLGFTDVAVYTASLQEWARDADAPLITGSA